jgi:hypothetical protein
VLTRKISTFGLIIGNCVLLGFLVMGGGLGARPLCVIQIEDKIVKIYFKIFFIIQVLSNISFCRVSYDTTFVNKEVLVNGTINESLKRYQVKIINVDIYINNNQEYEDSHSKIIILDTLKADTLSIGEFSWKSFQKESDKYQLTDINFDGFNDLLVLTGYSANGINEEYEIYFFNKINNHFEYNDYLTWEIGFNTSINKEAKEITTGGADGWWNYEWRTYKYLNEKLEMIHSESQERLDSLDLKTNDNLYKWTEQVRINNELITVKQIIGTLEQIQKETDK